MVRRTNNLSAENLNFCGNTILSSSTSYANIRVVRKSTKQIIMRSGPTKPNHESHIYEKFPRQILAQHISHSISLFGASFILCARYNYCRWFGFAPVRCRLLVPNVHKCITAAHRICRKARHRSTFTNPEHSNESWVNGAGCSVYGSAAVDGTSKFYFFSFLCSQQP